MLADQDLEVALLAIDAERARRSLATFIREGAWSIVEPETPLVWNWHLDALCQHLEAVAAGRIRSLLVNVPPGTMKSLTTCVFFPAWMWARRPTWRVMAASYAEALALRDSVKCRTLVESDWYQRRFVRGAWKLAGDQNVKGWYATSRQGFRLVTSVGGKGSGLRADALIVDDPLNADDAFSKAARDQVIRWWRYTFGNRLSDMRTGARIVIQQRLHEEDLAGWLLREDPSWTLLRLPSEYEPEHACSTSLGFRDPRTEPGELLFPERFPQEVIEAERRRLGSLGYPGQHQQRPSAIEGGILKRAWWRYFKPPLDLSVADRADVRKALKLSRIVQSWDTAHTEKKLNDYSDCLTVGVAPDRYILLENWKQRVEYPELKRAVQQKADRWRPDAVLVEDKAAGLPVVQDLRRDSRLPLILVTPEGDKVARASAASPSVEAGLWWLPEGAGWADDFVESCAAFPNAAHDDDVDAFTQARTHLMGGGGGQGLLEYVRRQAAALTAREGDRQ